METAILDELPVSYAVGLRMRASGADDHAIAAALGIAVEAVPMLLDIGLAKARQLGGSR